MRLAGGAPPVRAVTRSPVVAGITVTRYPPVRTARRPGQKASRPDLPALPGMAGEVLAVPDPFNFEFRPRDSGFAGFPVSDGLNRAAQEVCGLLVGQSGVLAEVLELVGGVTYCSSSQGFAGFMKIEHPCCFSCGLDTTNFMRAWW